jgi:diguanylate cyclase (GGDEF)-like protein/PAS domain S-box-containing protein
MIAVLRRAATSFRNVLPRGGSLPADLWQARHRTVLLVLWLHVAGIPVFALVRGEDLGHGLTEAGVVGIFAATATFSKSLPRGARAGIAGAGLMTASAVLVHLAGGAIEMHFHFFVMVGLITLYQDWVPFLVSIGFVAAHHGVVGVVLPRFVFDHQPAQDKPLLWAGIHALFVLAASAAHITSWRLVETQHGRAKEEIRISGARFQALIEHSSDGITVTDADGNIVYDSPSVTAMLGYDDGERIGRPSSDFIHADDVPLIINTFEKLSGASRNETVEVRLHRKDGDFRWAEVHLSNLLDQPDVAGIVANFRDVTERRQLESRLAHQAFHDDLTGLANRALFQDRVEHALAAQSRGGGRLALIFIDLDDFKTVNDAHGHGTGDEVLVTAARRIEAAVRPGDTCARFGGDEFAILLEQLPQPGLAYEVGARILESLRSEMPTSVGAVELNASLGIVFSTDGSEAADLIRNADLAMYEAKGQGKGRFEIFEQGMHDAVLERLALKADLRRAVERDEFVPHYQPVIELSTGRIVGAEALARWEHPERGLLVPAAFIDLAEETGLIVPLGRNILRRACADAARWGTTFGDAPKLSVNLSARQLQHDAIVEDVATILAETGLDPAFLTLEITESVLIADPDAASKVLARLKTLGVTLALDDFGTGYSSLSHLGRFPVDVLKIDRSFVAGMSPVSSSVGASDTETALLEAIVGLGQMLHLDVVAEGIERPDQLARLDALGCGLGQGYLFAKPMPDAEFNGIANLPAAVA